MTLEAQQIDVTRLGEVYRRHVNQTHAVTSSVMAPHAEVRAEGSLVYDEAGHEYLDCGGHAVFLLGHRHPDVVAAVRDQLEAQPLQARFLLSPPLARAAEALARVTPEGLEYSFFLSSGTEAVEMAIKLARLAGRRRIVATEGGFHGKTMGALSVTSKAGYREPFEPLLDGVAHVPYGDAAALEQALEQAPGECVFFVEPVQGEAGVVIPPEGYLSAAEQACRRHGALLVLDEIQTGLCRLGRFWGADFEGVRPDMLLSGKTLGGGVLPVSAVVARPEVYEPLNRDPYLHTSTFANAPILAAAAAATIEVLEQGEVLERVASVGESLLARLRALVAEHGEGTVAELRGRGLLIGIEFAAPGLAGEFLFDLVSRRVLPSYSLNQSATIRLTPSAFLSDSQQDWLLEAVEAALGHVKAIAGG